MSFFKERIFQVELDGKKYIELTGEEILKLSNQVTLTRNLLDIESAKEPMIEFEPRMNRNVSELNLNDGDGVASNRQSMRIKSNMRLSFPKTDRTVDKMIMQATKGFETPEVEMSLDTTVMNESNLNIDGTRSESAQVESQVKHQALKISATVPIERPLSTVSII